MERWADQARRWSPPPAWGRVLTVDAHTAGEPLRVILAGFPHLEGDHILARRRDARERHDAVRTALMWEPRGHPDMYGCIVTPPVTSGADVGVLFTHNEGYSTMCGHGIIAVTTVLLELGVLGEGADEGRIPVGIDTPAGFVQAWGTVEGGRVVDVEFRNVPSFVTVQGASVHVEGVGEVPYDVAFGGAFYAFVDATALGLRLVPSQVGDLIRVGRAIKEAVSAADPPRHPADPDLGFLYGTIFVAAAEVPSAHSRNVCVFADGEVDRSPTGTGVSARLALHHAKGELGVGDAIRIESILGTVFSGAVERVSEVSGIPAVIPRVSGRAHITGRSEFFLDPMDPLRDGFLLR